MLYWFGWLIGCCVGWCCSAVVAGCYYYFFLSFGFLLLVVVPGLVLVLDLSLASAAGDVLADDGGGDTTRTSEYSIPNRCGGPGNKLGSLWKIRKPALNNLSINFLSLEVPWKCNSIRNSSTRCNNPGSSVAIHAHSCPSISTDTNNNEKKEIRTEQNRGEGG